MIFKHKINESGADLDEFNNSVSNGKDAYVLVFRDGCPPCEETLPKWHNIESEMTDKYKNNNDVIVASINQLLLDKINHIGNIEGFPTMKHISKNGGVVEEYENSPINTKDRSTSSFIEWIEHNLGNHYSEKPIDYSDETYLPIRELAQGVNQDRPNPKRRTRKRPSKKTKRYRNKSKKRNPTKNANKNRRHSRR